MIRKSKIYKAWQLRLSAPGPIIFGHKTIRSIKVSNNVTLRPMDLKKCLHPSQSPHGVI